MTAVSETTQINDCESVTGWTSITISSPGLDSDFFIEQANSIASDLDIETGYLVYTLPANIDVTGTGTTYQNMKNVWWYFLGLLPSFLDTWENGGFGLRVYDGSGNYSMWYVGGEDTYNGGWRRFCVNLDTTPDYISGTLDLTDIDRFEFRFKALFKSKLSDNIFIDDVRLGTVTEGMQVDGGTTGTPYTFDDWVSDGETAVTGLIRKTDGTFFINGPITWGDPSSGDAIFTDSLQSLRTENTYREFTTANRGSGESYVSPTHYTLTIVNSATGDCRFIVGEKSGVRGISGINFVKGGTGCDLYITATDTDIDYLQFYGSSLIGAGDVLCPVGASNREFVDVTFIDSGTLKPSTMSCDFLKFISSPGVALELDSLSHDVIGAEFITCDTGVEVTITGTITFDNFQFTGSVTADVENPNNATTTDSYSESNQDTDQTIGNGTINRGAESFTGDGNVLSRARIWLKKSGTLTGTIVAKVYLATGSAPNAYPTGAALATSETIPATDIGDSYAAHDFEFEDEFTLVNSTEYFISIEYTGDGSNYLIWGTDSSSPPAGSNFATYTTSWSAVSSDDGCFYIYTGGIVKASLTNDSNPGVDNNSGTPPGATIMPISVNLTVTVKRDDNKVVIEFVEVAIFRLDNDLELMNEQTNASGIATQPFVYPGSEVDIYWRVREIPSTDPQFLVESSEAQINSNGFSQTVFLKNAPYIDDVS